MVFAVVLTIASLVYAKRTGDAAFLTCCFLLLFAALLHAFWWTEHLNRLDGYFISDEQYFIDAAENVDGVVFGYTHGFGWVWLNMVLRQWDVWLGGLVMKFANVPFLLLFTVALYRIYGRRTAFLALPILLPYTVWIATFNMRDVAIMGLLAVTVCHAFERGPVNRGIATAGLIGLILLRPVVGAVCLFIILVVMWGRPATMRDRRRFPIMQRVGAIAIPLIALTMTIGSDARDRVVRDLAFVWYVRTDGYEAVAARRAGEFRTDSRVSDMAISYVRYVSTPLPTSLAGRIADGGSELWGVTDDIVRVVHQSVFFLMLGFVLTRPRRSLRTVLSLRGPQLAMWLILFSYSVMYSIHLFGVGHQRLKVPFQLAVGILAILLITAKDNESRVPHGRLAQ